MTRFPLKGIMSAVLNDQDWQVRAACRGPQIKFSFLHHILKEKSDKRERERRAKLICKTCSVQMIA